MKASHLNQANETSPLLRYHSFLFLFFLSLSVSLCHLEDAFIQTQILTNRINLTRLLLNSVGRRQSLNISSLLPEAKKPKFQQLLCRGYQRVCCPQNQQSSLKDCSYPRLSYASKLHHSNFLRTIPLSSEMLMCQSSVSHLHLCQQVMSLMVCSAWGKEVVSVPGPSRGVVSLLIFLLACSCLFAVCPDSAKTLLSLDLIQCYLNCKSIDYKIN